MKFLLCVALLFSSLAHAQGSGTLTGLWWNPAEPGWGVSFHEQGDVTIANLLVYDRDGAPVWYHSSMRARLVPSTTYTDDDAWLFEGDLLRATQPPAQSKRVGTIRFVMSQDQASVGYTVDGRDYGSPVTRAIWAQQDLRGTFAGVRSLRSPAACAVSENIVPASVDISQDGDSVRIELADEHGRCVAQGFHFAQGATGWISGTAECTGTNGFARLNFAAWDVRVDRLTASFGYSLEGKTCSQSGALNAARTVARTLHDDASGIFYDPQDPGWSVAVQEQGGVLFAIILTYRADGNPTWLVAPAVPYVEGDDGDFVTYRGDLAIATGTPFERPGYRASDFRARPVGTFELQFDTAGYHYLAFDHDGQSIGSTVRRLTWNPLQPPVGTYAGVRTDLFATLAPGSPPAAAYVGRWTFSADGEVRIRLVEENLTCDIEGNYWTEGATAQVNAARSTCTDKAGNVTTGHFFAYEIHRTAGGLSMGYSLSAGHFFSWGTLAGVSVD